MKVLISLSSFGAAETGRHGQLWCTDLAQQAGADGVEVRGELLRDAATELPALAGRAAVYSSPEGLFWAKLSAASLMAIAPIVVFGWFSQKQLVQGLTFGAVK